MGADIADFAAGPRSKADEEDEGIVKYPSAGLHSKAQAPRSKAEEENEGIVQYPSVGGPRSKAKVEEDEEEEGIVKYPSAGPRATAAEEEDEEEGVVDYPAVGAGSRHGAEQKDLTGPDGLGDPSDWDPPPREIPHAGPRRGGGAAAAGSVRCMRTHKCPCGHSACRSDVLPISSFLRPVALVRVMLLILMVSPPELQRQARIRATLATRVVQATGQALRDDPAGG